MGETIFEVDPKELRLPPSRANGADPWKLHLQLQKHGTSKENMPPIFVYEDPDGLFEIFDGVTRATRIAKLAPGTTVPVVVIGQFKRSRAKSRAWETFYDQSKYANRTLHGTSSPRGNNPRDARRATPRRCRRTLRRSSWPWAVGSNGCRISRSCVAVSTEL